jgi:hypothetical protein
MSLKKCSRRTERWTSATPEPSLSLKPRNPPNGSHEKYSRHTKRTSVSPKHVQSEKRARILTRVSPALHAPAVITKVVPSGPKKKNPIG